MQQWLTSKLEHITKEFLKGDGYGAVYEAQFLAYLETLVVCRSGVDNYWQRFQFACANRTPKGMRTRPLSHYIEDRQTLVDALAGFARQFEGPKKQTLTTPTAKKQAQNEAKPRTSNEGVSMGFLDFLTGDDE